MIITEIECRHFMRRVLDEMAHRLDIGDPQMMDENTELLPAIMHQDSMAYQVMGAFRSTYRLWYNKSLELEQAASQEKDLTTIRKELIRLMKARDVTREALIRYLDHHYPRSNARIAV